MTHLEAEGGEQLAALGEYLVSHPAFPALRSLRLGGTREVVAEQVADIVQALGQVRAEALKELEILEFGVPFGALGVVIGNMPNLSTLRLVRKYHSMPAG